MPWLRGIQGARIPPGGRVAACARASGRVGRNGTPKIAPHPARLRLRECGRWPSCLTASSQWDAGPISPASPPILEQPGRWPTTSLPPGIRALTTRATVSPRSAELRVSPQARNSVDRDGRPACCGSASCIQICPIGAKYDATVHLSSAEEWRCHPRPDDCHESRNRRRRQRQCDQLQALGRQRRRG